MGEDAKGSGRFKREKEALRAAPVLTLEIFSTCRLFLYQTRIVHIVYICSKWRLDSYCKSYSALQIFKTSGSATGEGTEFKGVQKRQHVVKFQQKSFETDRATKRNWNKAVLEKVSKQFWNSFVSASFRCADMQFKGYPVHSLWCMRSPRFFRRTHFENDTMIINWTFSERIHGQFLNAAV